MRQCKSLADKKPTFIGMVLRCLVPLSLMFPTWTLAFSQFQRKKSDTIHSQSPLLRDSCLDFNIFTLEIYICYPETLTIIKNIDKNICLIGLSFISHLCWVSWILRNPYKHGYACLPSCSRKIQLLNLKNPRCQDLTSGHLHSSSSEMVELDYHYFRILEILFQFCRNILTSCKKI